MAQGLVRTFGSQSHSREEEGFGLWREVDRVFDNIARSFGRGEGRRHEIAKGFAGEVLAPNEPLPVISDDDEPALQREPASRHREMESASRHREMEEEVRVSRTVQAKTEVLNPTQPTPIRLNRAANAPSNGTLSPVSDAFEDDDCYEVTIELPGVQDSDIDIEFGEGAVTVSAERKKPADGAEGNNRKHHLRERSFGTFRRRFALPFQANPDIIQASFEGGVVTVHIPRPPETKPRIKKIDLKKH